MPPRREASRDLQAAFYGAESGSEKRPSFPQIMQGTVPARAPPRMAGTARSPPPNSRDPWEVGCVAWVGCRQHRSWAQRSCPRSGGCLRTGPASAPGLKLHRYLLTPGVKGGGWPGVTQHFICSSIWGGLGSSTPQPGPELMNLSGTAVCFSHKWGWEVVSWMRRAYYSLKQVL